jgi:uncharacterized damage-inducible protein DinB
MNENQKLSDELFKSVFGDPWHGASLKNILESCPAEKIFLKPITNAHSIIELALHINTWTEEVLSRFEGNPPAEPKEGDWPNTQSSSAEYWESLKQKIYDNTNKLIDVVKNMTDEKLNEPVGKERNAPLGTGYTFEEMLIGLLQHNAYHAGQISLLAK